MKALQFDLHIPKYLVSKVLGKFSKKAFFGRLSCLTYRETESPRPINENWVRIRTRLSGICGSDLNAICTKESLSLEPFASFPFTYGHENCGVIEEVGSNVPEFQSGQRVVVDSVLACPQRGIQPLCEHCARGDFSQCSNLTEGDVSPGLYTGYNRDTGGGWSRVFIAHKTQLVKIPDEITDSEAVLIDSFASALHPVMRNKPKNGDTVVVYGAGTMGLMTIASIRALNIGSRIILLIKYPFQGEMGRKLGADVVLNVCNDDIYEGIRKTTNAKVFKPSMAKRVMIGGPDIVFDCVGSSTSVDNSLRLLKAGGKLVLIGSASKLKGVDWSLVWFKELTISGSNSYGTELDGGKPKRTFDIAIEMILSRKVDLKPLVTHKFPLKDYAKALEVASDKKKYKATKVVFDIDEEN